MPESTKPTRQGDSGAIVNPNSKGNAQSFASHVNSGYEADPLAKNTTDPTVTKTFADIVPGDILVYPNGDRLTIEDLYESSTEPGSKVLEHAWGTTIRENEEEVTVVNTDYVEGGEVVAAPKSPSFPEMEYRAVTELKAGDVFLAREGRGGRTATGVVGDLWETVKKTTTHDGVVHISVESARTYDLPDDRKILLKHNLTSWQKAANWFYDSSGDQILRVDRERDGYHITQVVQLDAADGSPARKVRASLRQNFYDFQSYMKVDVFDGTDWKTLDAISGSTFHSKVPRATTDESDEDILDGANEVMSDAIINAIQILR